MKENINTQKIPTKRNLSIEMVKLFFAISIALGHYSAPIIDSRIVVFLFFVLSGYFLVGSFDSNKYNNSWQYTLNRIKSIYPYYLFAFTILFFAKNYKLLFQPLEFFKNFLRSLPELFLLQNVGIFPGGINYPLWQLCTLIVVSHIFFTLLSWNRDMTLNAICPIIALCTFTYLVNAYSTNEPNWWGVIDNYIYVPLLRAAASVSVGMFAHYPVKALLRKIENNSNKYIPVLVSFASVPLIIIFWLNRNSYIIVIPFLLLMVCLFYSKGIYAKIFQIPALAKLDKLSLAIYLNHALIILILKKFNVFSDIIFLLILFIYSIVMLLIVDKLHSTCNKFLKCISIINEK